MNKFLLIILAFLVVGAGAFWEIKKFSAKRTFSGNGLSAPQESRETESSPQKSEQNDEKPTGSSDAKGAPPSPSAAALRECLAKSASEINRCLDGIFHDYLKTHTTSQALALLSSYEDTDTALRLSCHPVAHSIGRETYLQKKTIHDSFAACDQTCHSGCYHGAIERFLRGSAGNAEEAHISEEEIKAKAIRACDPDQPFRIRFQCLHGLGHALMFFLDYKLEKTLGVCDELPDAWSRSSCYGGAFMENVFSATPEKRDLSKTDYHYPCNKLEARYKSDCYMMQTTRMSEMGLGIDGLFRECRNAGEYTAVCFQSIGRDLSNDVRIQDPRTTAEKCEKGTIGKEQEACVRGVAYALIDNTWDGKYALPFCAAIRGARLRMYCFSQSKGYMNATYQKSENDFLADCKKYLPAPNICTLR